MPNDTDRKLAAAKSALSSANKFTASTGDTSPSIFSAAKPKPAAPAVSAAKPKVSVQDEAGSAAAGIKARGEQTMGSFKDGGTVPKTGVYKLHKDEKVIPADKAKSSGVDKSILEKATSALGGKPKSKLEMRIRQTDDNRFHVQHSYSGGEPTQSSTEHAPSSLDELLDHVKSNYSTMNQDPAPKATEKD